MFLGHFGIGFGAKSVSPKTSLGTLFLAAQFVDLLWPTLLLFGLEHVAISPGITKVTPLDFFDYPISHSLMAAVLWGLAFGLVYFVVRRYPMGAWVCGLAVVSHWFLDLVVHRPDLPVAPGLDLHVGFGLWNSVPVTLVLEVGIFALGVVLYVRTTTAGDRAGSLGLWGLVVFLALIYAANIFGQPPPNVVAIAWVGQAQWLLIVWAYWIDRHRASRSVES